jgi:recombination DNA repair RAD52 pathway protein
MELTMAELEKLFTEMLDKHTETLKAELEKMVAEKVASLQEEAVEEPEAEVEVEGLEMAEEEVAEEAAASSEEETSLEEDKVEDEDEAMSTMKTKLREYERKSMMAEARVAVLEKELQLTVARSEVQKDLQNRPHLSHMAERMANIYVEDKGLYDDMLNIAVDSRSVFSERTFRGSEITNSKPLSSDPFVAAAELAERDGIGYSEAFNKVSGK